VVSSSRVVRLPFRVALWSTSVFVLVVLTDSVVAAPGSEPAALVQHIQSVVDRLRDALGIPDQVNVAVLPQVALVVSVEAPADRSQPFQLMIEDRFHARLNDDEVDAALAHELGHVWLFTHHPYLQTERLANQIAMRVVTRESLTRVYEKLWEHGATTGNLAAYLGP
jgi:hypothetical protein